MKIIDKHAQKEASKLDFEAYGLMRPSGVSGSWLPPQRPERQLVEETLRKHKATQLVNACNEDQTLAAF